MKGVKIINKNGTVNTIDSDFFVNEQKRSVANPTPSSDCTMTDEQNY